MWLIDFISFFLYIKNMNQNKRKHVENEGLANLVRGEWFAQFRWIAGLSTFVIGIALTIYTFMRTDTYWHNYLILFFTTIVLLINIIIIKKLMKDCLKYYNTLAHGPESELDENNFWNMRDEKLPRLESRMHRTFLFGLSFFILFVLSYLVPEHIVKIFYKTILLFIQIIA